MNNNIIYKLEIFPDQVSDNPGVYAEGGRFISDSDNIEINVHSYTDRKANEKLSYIVKACKEAIKKHSPIN